MQIPDPIRPYADLIRLGLVVLLASGLYVAGCQRGEDRQGAADRAQIDTVQRQLDGARAEAAENLRAANAAGQLLQEVNRQCGKLGLRDRTARRARNQHGNHDEGLRLLPPDASVPEACRSRNLVLC